MYICIVYDMECSVRVLILFLIYILNLQLDPIFSFSLEQEQLGLLWNTELHQGTSDNFNGTMRPSQKRNGTPSHSLER